MKRLLILRHAQALGTEAGGSDKTRKLSPNGIKDAQVLGQLMAREGLQPDAVLCSAATRTRQTLESVLEGLEETSVDYLDRLYNSDFDLLISAIHEVDDAVSTLLLVAHNPGIHTLAARLAADDGSPLSERLLMGYAPATLTVLECEIESWENLRTYSNKVAAVHETTEYNADARPTRWM